MFHCLVIKVCCVCLSDSSFILSHLKSFVKYFFQLFSNSFFDESLSRWQLVYFIMSASICQQVFSFFWKIYFFQKNNGEGGIWTLAPSSRPIPLAGAPLRPLEYFSRLRTYNFLLNWSAFLLCFIRNAWLIIAERTIICQHFFYFFYINFILLW